MISLLSSFAYYWGFVVCHQISERSFRFFNQPVCFCSRCLGIYSAFFIMLGYFFGVKVLLKGERPKRMLHRNYYFLSVFLICLMALDVFLQSQGLYFSNVTRLFSGLFFGFGTSLYILTLFVDDAASFKDSKKIFSKKELLLLSLLLVVFAVVVLLKFDLLLLIAHVFAGFGVIFVGMVVSFVLVSFAAPVFRVRMRRLHLYSVFLFVIGAVLLFLVHYFALQYLDI